MKASRFWMVVPALLLGWAIGMAYAKLPAPSAVDPAKAAAAKAKAAAAAKKEAEELSRAQDRAVARYKKEKGIKASAAAAPKKER